MFSFFREILAYVMVPIIQHQVDVFVELWNNHRIRKQKETYLPTGKPSHIYSFPENWGLHECGMLILPYNFIFINKLH